MKKKKIFQVISLFFFLSLMWGYASSQSSVSINSIFVQTEELNTLILLESTAPLLITGTYYSQDDPATIVVELDKVTTEAEIPIDLTTAGDKIQSSKDMTITAKFTYDA